MMWIDSKLFRQLTENYFSFLQSEYGMDIQEKETLECVRFKSNITWLDIWFDKYSIYIELGTNDGLYRTSLWDIMQFVNGSGKLSCYMASDEEKLKKGLKRLSDYVKSYCQKALLGDVKFYKNIQRRQEEYSRDIALKNKLSYIEELVKIAWKNKDYCKIIELYNSVLEHLSPMQNKKLKLCKKLLENNKQ